MNAIAAPEIAILIPCYNEAAAIGRVVHDFREALPTASIYVYDNNSADDTVAQARAAGAIVRREPRQGKGNVVRRMFADVEADVYVMVDGDATYDARSARDLVEHLLANQLDFVNGSRKTIAVADQSYRPGHRTGNWIISNTVGFVFNRGIEDMLSGLKVMSKRFVKSFPCLSTGFEIETEITVHALELSMPLGERPVPYGERLVGSASKLNTIRDGVRIAKMIFKLLRTEKPMLFFGGIFLVLAAVATFLGIGLFIEFRATGLVVRFPTAILATGMMLVAFLSAACGLILENVKLGRAEAKRMTYLSIPRTSAQAIVSLRERTASPLGVDRSDSAAL
jgi:glycosyltransferase involved in cell wall biosynthesis